MIRPATAQDVLTIVDRIEDLRAAVGGPVPVDRAWTARTVASLIESDDGLVLVSPGGFIAAALVQTIISPARICQELGWHATDGSGLRLLRQMEAWARARGATLVQLSTGPVGPDLARLGYWRAEQAWVRSV